MQCLSIHGGILHASMPISTVGCRSGPACFTWCTIAIFDSFLPGKEPGAPTGDPLLGCSAPEFLRTRPEHQESPGNPGAINGLHGSPYWGLSTAHRFHQIMPVHHKLCRAANCTGAWTTASTSQRYILRDLNVRCRHMLACVCVMLASQVVLQSANEKHKVTQHTRVWYTNDKLFIQREYITCTNEHPDPLSLIPN